MFGACLQGETSAVMQTLYTSKQAIILLVYILIAILHFVWLVRKRGVAGHNYLILILAVLEIFG